jgi:hypothetical protein
MSVTVLQSLNQNLNQIKVSRLMDNELIKSLYNEAKHHEKNAKINNLITRVKKYSIFSFYLYENIKKKT